MAISSIGVLKNSKPSRDPFLPNLRLSELIEASISLMHWDIRSDSWMTAIPLGQDRCTTAKRECNYPDRGSVVFIARLEALVLKPRAYLTRFHGVLAPNLRWRALITPAIRGKGASISNMEVGISAERHAAMTWAPSLKRVFNIEIEVYGRCGVSVRVIACIEDQDIIDRTLAHLESKEHNTPALPHLAPPTRALLGTMSLFAGSESTTQNQQACY
jgi:hypothetical protein